MLVPTLCRCSWESGGGWPSTWVPALTQETQKKLQAPGLDEPSRAIEATKGGSQQMQDLSLPETLPFNNMNDLLKRCVIVSSSSYKMWIGKLRGKLNFGI